MIRVVVVEDSATARGRLVAVLAATPDLEVVGEAADGAHALELVAALRPDVVTLDLVLPDTTGLTVTEHIMAHVPTPILIVSAASNRGAQHDTYEALAAGAVDVLDKPQADEHDWDARFVAAVRLVSKIKVITHPRARLRALGRARTVPPAVISPRPAPYDVVALGASTGGPGALVEVVGSIPPAFPIPIVIVLHLDAAFAASFADWLGSETGRAVWVAREGDAIDGPPGRVLLAPPGYHLAIADRRVRLTHDAPRHHCRPSIDVLFESIAIASGARAAACVLTGMGKDGAAGLLAIRTAGGATFAQDAATSVVYGMPREAAMNGGAERVLPLEQIGPALAALASMPAVPRTRSR